MKKMMEMLVVLLALSIAPPAAQAMLVDVPLEIIAQQAELIVVVEVVEAGQPAQLQLNVPDSPRPVNAWFRRYKLKVTRVIKEKPKAAAAARPGDRKIDVLTRCPRPQPPGGLRIFVSDQYFASLRVGQSYVLILRSMAGKPEYYLPTYPKNYRPDRPEEVAKIQKAADVSKWPWGKAVNGLQIALVPDRPEATLRTVRQRLRGKGGALGPPVIKTLAYVKAVVALRNTSKKALAVNLYMGDAFLKVEGTGPAGKTVSPDLYGFLAAMRLTGPRARDVVKIEPGKVMFITPRGQAKYGMGWRLELTPGKWKFAASYNSTRKTSGKALWTGTITSAPVQIQVSPNVRVPLPRGRPN